MKLACYQKAIPARKSNRNTGPEMKLESRENSGN